MAKIGPNPKEQSRLYTPSPFLTIYLSQPLIKASTSSFINRYLHAFSSSKPQQSSFALFFHQIMPRRSSGRSARPAPRPAARNPPQPVRNAPPPAPAPASSGGSMLGGIGSTIAQGVAFGTGSAAAHRAVDAVMGPRTIQHETVGAAEAQPAPSSNSVGDACGPHSKAFQDCLNNYGSDISKCQFYLDMLTDCRKSSGSAIGA